MGREESVLREEIKELSGVEYIMNRIGPRTESSFLTGSDMLNTTTIEECRTSTPINELRRISRAE